MLYFIINKSLQMDKQNYQALFHFLLCELIVECSEHSKQT